MKFIENKKTYISEIDTLRALAVVLVVVFHAFPTSLPGGFIGVDVFFTISGFVICKAYLRLLIDNEISLTDFYLARFRRLAPAAFLVLFLTTVAASTFVLPDNLINFANSLIAQALYVQNFVFWVEGDYFSGALTKPLLHTWSLAVEEQFYILWALLIIFFRRYPKLVLAVTLVGAAGSIGLGYLLEPRSPKTVFYLLPTRIWEFAIGILAFLAAEKCRPFSGKTPNFILAATLISISATAFVFDEKNSFPGTQSLIACLATGIALFLFDRSNHKSAIYNLKPLLYIGKISYSLYLWHWPPLVLFFLKTGRPATPAEAALLMALAFIGAALSFHWLEQPIRRGSYFRQPSRTYKMVLACSLLLVATGGIFITSKGLLFRYPEEIQPLLAAPHERGKFRCGQQYVMLNPRSEMCPLNGINGTGGILVLGDSHADVLKELLGDLAFEKQLPIYLTTRNCDLGRYGTYAFCSDQILATIAKQAKKNDIKNIIAISYWETDKFNEETLQKDVDYLNQSGFKIHLMRVVPNHDSYDPKARALSALQGGELKLDGITLTEYQVLTRRESEIFQSIDPKQPGYFNLLVPSEYICPEGACLWSTDGIPNYLDTNHLTFTGSKLLAPMFSELLGNIKNRQQL